MILTKQNIYKLREFNPCMLFNKTSKIIKNKDLLSIDYVPKTIVGRDNEIKELAFHLSYIFRENPSLPQQLIFGGVGTGKTTIIRYILKQLEKETKDQKINLKIIKIKGSESRTKYEILKRILSQTASDVPITTATADLHSKIIRVVAERGIYVLIFIDEIHELRESELNGTLYTISRLGQDIAFADTKNKSKIEKVGKGNVGYLLVSNDANIRSKLKENTRSSLTRENIIFKRYEPNQIIDILESRIKEGAIYKEKIQEGVLEMIAAASVKEGQDARYALILLSNSAKEAEKRNFNKVTRELVGSVNQFLIQDYMKQLLRDLPNLYMEILLIIYELHKREGKINSKTIWEEYKIRTYLPEVNFSRISQIITALEKENIVYVTQSKKTKLRNLSIEENLKEIKEILKERGKLD